MTHREVRDLAAAFTKLIDNLGQQKSMLRDANAGLEQRVTERMAEAERNVSHLRLIADNLPVMIANVDRDERYTNCNNAYFANYGVTPAAMIGSTVLQLLGETMYGTAKPYIDRVMKGERVLFLNQRIAHAQLIYLQMTYIPDIRADGSVAGFHAMSQDVTDCTNQRLSLQHDALHDSLTGLPNRTASMEQIKGAIARCHRSGKALAVLFMDMDRFKLVNDTYGHATGDLVLIEFSRRVKSCMRKSSVGIAMHIMGETTAEAILKHADSAMYDAKRGGNGRIAGFVSP